jgi:hypothetical protein
MNDQAEKSAAYVSVKDAAQRMFNDTSRSTVQRVQRLCVKKEIPAVRDGRRWWVKIDEVVDEAHR